MQSPLRPPLRHRASLLARTQAGLHENEPLLSPQHSPVRSHFSPNARSHPFDYGTAPPLLHTPDGRLDDRLEAGQLLLVPAGATNPEAPGASSKLSIVIGLLAHSVADGLALGAAQLSSVSSAPARDAAHDSSPSLSLVVFLAILLHKFPTAFALSSLLSRSSTRRFALSSLAAFSLAAPVSAVAAFNVLAWLGTGDARALDWWTGLGVSGTRGATCNPRLVTNRAFFASLQLVFSGGTFLFVATAVMKGGAEEEHGDNWKLTEKKKVGLVILGMVIPGLLTELVHFIKS